MANKTTIGNPQEAAIRNRQSVDQAGLNFENIEKILQNRSIASILSDFPLVANFLQKQFTRFTDLVYPKYGFKSMYAEPPALEQYNAHFSADRDTSKGKPFVDYIESKYFANPELFVSMGILSPQQVECLRKLMTQGCLADLDAMKGKTSAAKVQEAEGEGGASTKGYGAKGYGSATPQGSQGPQGTTGSGGSGYGFKGFGEGEPATAPGYPGGGGGGDYGTSGYGGGGFDTGSGGAGMAANLSHQQQQEILGMVGNTPVSGFFGLLMDREDRAKSIFMNIFDRMNRRTNDKNQIMMEINQLDLSSPEGQKKFYMLQQELQGFTQSEKEDYDLITRVQQSQNEFIQLVKKILDDFYKTQEKIIDRWK